jgi:hypothetical protein
MVSTVTMMMTVMMMLMMSMVMMTLCYSFSNHHPSCHGHARTKDNLKTFV